MKRLHTHANRLIELTRRVLALLYPIALIGLAAQGAVAPQRVGPLAVAGIVAPLLFAPLLVLLPRALRPRAAGIRLLLAACAVLFLLDVVSWEGLRPASSGATGEAVSFATWNVSAENGEPGALAGFLRDHPAAVVALEEVRWADLAVTDAAARYPYRLDRQANSVPGLALLSIYPIRASGVVAGTVDEADAAGAIWSRLDIGGESLLVVVAHTRAPYTHTAACSPLVCFDPEMRDQQLGAIRAFLTPFTARGEAVLLLGDLNVTERESAYRDLARGLRDVQRHVSAVPGATWRPFPLARLPMALLRIDYALASSTVASRAAGVDCAPRGSDHCVLAGVVVVGGDGSAPAGRDGQTQCAASARGRAVLPSAGGAGGRGRAMNRWRK